jgi:acetyl-CoA carboxylase biotin carboxyl carrier protein
MIDLKTLKEYVKLMVANDLTELDLKGEGESVLLKRAGGAGGAGEGPPQVQYVPQTLAPAPTAQPQPSPAAPAAATPPVDEGLTPIASPMVGTFYSSSSPDAKAFVNVGDKVKPDTVVCIVEAMKVFNEIRAEIAGTVEKVLVENGQAIEFGQPLFLIRTK